MSGWSQSIIDDELLRKIDLKPDDEQTPRKNLLAKLDQNQDTINASLEIIEESPTGDVSNRTSVHQSIRERLRNATIARKQVLKRNKSDSVLVPAQTNAVVVENESLSKFFQSQFDVPAEDKSKIFGPKDDVNMINLSKLMSEYYSLNLDESKKDEPVLSNYDDLFKDSFKIEIDFPGETAEESLPLEFSEKIMDQAISDDILIKETEDLLSDVDSMSFVQQQADNLENSLFIEREMEKEKQFLRSTLISQEEQGEIFKAPDFSFKHASSQLNKSLVVDSTKNLLLISNWNLPTAVVKEYMKKNVIEMFDWQCACLKNPKVSFIINKI